jgi:CHAT domain-containing protein
LKENSKGHIRTEELAKLLEATRGRPDSTMDMRALHPHLAVCASCREQYDGLASLDRELGRQLKSMNSVEPTPRSDQCPDGTVWRAIASGLTPTSETLASLEHASRCAHCGPLLRAAVDELIALNGEVTEAERRHIATLASAQDEWQSSLARRIAATLDSRDPKPPRRWQVWLAFPRLAMAGVTLIAVIGVGSWFAVRRNQPAAAEHLLAHAYTDKRTLELRIAGAAHAPMRVSRGPATSFTSRPAALLKAEALIATQLEAHPADPSWLQANAQANILEGKYDAAVEELHRALELNPRSPTLLTDMATAEFQRALEDNRDQDFGAAFESLSQALKISPDDPVALFNRAIVAEYLFLYQQAVDDWDHYLRVDSSSQWADEARHRADAVREKLKQHGSVAPLLSPSQIGVGAATADFESEIDERIEEYLHEAVRAWLPQAFPEASANKEGSGRDPSAEQALFFLANLTSQRHGDQWLADLLHGSSSPNFPRAANALARAVKANDVGDLDVSRQQAALAERLFRGSGNMAGVLRAQFEQAFAAQIERDSEDCRRRSVTAEADAKRYPYPWIQIQLGLEEGVCSDLMSNLGAYQRAATRAKDSAQQAGYGALYLRALGFIAETKFDTGDPSGGWKLVRTGLDRYWSEQFPAMRGYNLYNNVALAAEAAGQSNLQLAIWREAADTIDAEHDLLLRAVAHSKMANAARTAHQPEIAELQYAEAAGLYALAPQTTATRGARLYSEIMTAQVEAHQGKFDTAVARLTRAQGEVRQSADSFVAQVFYSTLGQVQLRSHHAVEAEQAFLPALRLAEQNLASLTSEVNRVGWSKDAAPIYLGLAEAKLLQGQEQESLGVFEWYLGAPQRVDAQGHSTSQRAPVPAQPLPDFSQLPPRLPLLSSQTKLAYGVLPDGLAIWVYDDHGVRGKWITKSPQELQDLASNFYAQCSDPGSDLSALRRDSRLLYSLLIGPVEEQLTPNRTLVIETEGFLAQVPFEALLDSSDQYLVERVPIVHSLGQYSEPRLSSDAAISSQSAALVVGSTASSTADGLIPLPDVAAEADTVASFFPSAHVFKGREVTLSAIRNELPGAAVFHFAGHALATPGMTGLLLESSGGQTEAPRLLDASVVRQLHLQGLQLAVLSACSTASGSGGSSGFDSVTDALLRAGVPHVLASRWTVDSVAARGFVQDFYRNALSGQPVSDAMRLTSQKMLADPRTSHPYYWTAFAVYGRS